MGKSDVLLMSFDSILHTSSSLVDVDLPPFALPRDFGKQNTHGNVSKISVSLVCYRQIGSKSTNHSLLA